MQHNHSLISMICSKFKRTTANTSYLTYKKVTLFREHEKSFSLNEIKKKISRNYPIQMAFAIQNTLLHAINGAIIPAQKFSAVVKM